MAPTMGGFIAQYFGRLLFMPLPLWELSQFDLFQPSRSRPSIVKPALRAAKQIKQAPVKTLLRNTDFILISLITFGVLLPTEAQNQICRWHPIGSTRTKAQIGFALTVVALVQLVSIFVSGKYLKCWTKGFITIGGYILVISLLMLTAVDSVRFLLLSCIVMGVGIGMCGTLLRLMWPTSFRENYSMT